MNRKLLIVGMVVGGLLTGSPIIGLLGTVSGILRAYAILGPSGIRDPGQLGAAVGETLVAAVAGVVVFLIGGGLFAFCLVAYLGGRKPPAGSGGPPA